MSTPGSPIVAFDIIQVKAQGIYVNRPIQLTLTYQVFVPDAVADYPTAITNILTGMAAAAWVNHYRACLPTTYQLVGLSAQRIGLGPQARSRAFEKQLSLAGTWPTVVSNNPASAAVIQRFSLGTGKTEQGDLHIGPLADNAAVAGQVSAGMTTALAALGADLVANVTYGGGGILQPVMYRYNTKAHPATPSYSILYGYTTGLKISTSRRRLLHIFG